MGLVGLQERNLFFVKKPITHKADAILNFLLTLRKVLGLWMILCPSSCVSCQSCVV